jgi:hypothetical protein
VELLSSALHGTARDGGGICFEMLGFLYDSDFFSEFLIIYNILF